MSTTHVVITPYSLYSRHAHCYLPSPMSNNHKYPMLRLEQPLFLLLLALITALFLYLIQPFFTPVFWACAIALLFYPVQTRLQARWQHRPNSTALATLLLCIVVLIIPVLLVLTSFVSEGAKFYAKIESGEIKPQAFLERLQSAVPAVQQLLDRLGLDSTSLIERASDAAVAASSFVASHALAVGQSTFQFFLNLALMLYLTFFLLRDGKHLAQLLSRALPLGDERERLLFAKFAEVTRATIKGNLVVAMVQGALGGFIFWVLGITAPVLWGVVMAALSLIPAIGAGLVWLPFSLYLFSTGEIGPALILLVYGVLVIGLADNVLRPILVGRDTRLPDWLVLLSTLGGLVLFGINGFVLGPLISALFMVFWQIFSREYHQDELVAETPSVDESNGAAKPDQAAN